MTELDHPLDYLAELALGVLEPEHEPGIRAHLAACETCRGEFETMMRAARALPFAVQELEPAPAVREGLMQRIASEPRALRPRRQPAAWQRFAAIAAAAAVLVVAGGFAGAMLTGNDGGLESEAARQRELVRAVARGDAGRDTAEQGPTRATLVYAPGTDSAFALIEGLPELPEGKTYKAWFIGGGTPRPSNAFTSGRDGIWLESPGAVDSFSAFALTIEDDADAKAPGQQPFVVVELGSSASHPITLPEWLALVERN